MSILESFEGDRCQDDDDEFPTQIDWALMGTLLACTVAAIIISIWILCAKSRTKKGKAICC